MNKVFIVGNLTRDPELRSTRDGISVCSFTVAVNRRVRNAEAGQPEADFFRVTAWRALGASLAGTADDVEFLAPRSEGGEAPAPRPQAAAPAAPQSNGFVQVDDDELPF